MNPTIKKRWKIQAAYRWLDSTRYPVRVSICNNSRNVRLYDLDGLGLFGCEFIQADDGMYLWTTGHSRDPGCLLILQDVLHEHGLLPQSELEREHWGRPLPDSEEREKLISQALEKLPSLAA